MTSPDTPQSIDAAPEPTMADIAAMVGAAQKAAEDAKSAAAASRDVPKAVKDEGESRGLGGAGLDELVKQLTKGITEGLTAQFELANAAPPAEASEPASPAAAPAAAEQVAPETPKTFAAKFLGY